MSVEQGEFLMGLATNFYGAIESIPPAEQAEIRSSQEEAADRRRSSESDEALLKRRIR